MSPRCELASGVRSNYKMAADRQEKKVQKSKWKKKGRIFDIGNKEKGKRSHKYLRLFKFWCINLSRQS